MTLVVLTYHTLKSTMQTVWNYRISRMVIYLQETLCLFPD